MKLPTHEQSKNATEEPPWIGQQENYSREIVALILMQIMII